MGEGVREKENVNGKYTMVSICTCMCMCVYVCE